jgi:hypothetical protein
MGTNGFREDELFTETVNGLTRVFPVVGGRLRLAHEENQNLNLQTEMVSWDGQYAIFKCSAVTSKGQYVGYGTANSQRDAKLAESLIELAETRSIARALRFAGYGVEFTSAEEVSHVVGTEPDRQHSGSKQPTPVFPEGNGNGKNRGTTVAQRCATGGAVPKASSDAIDPGENGSKPQHGGNGTVTQAQCRALYALTKRAKYHEADIGEMLARFDVSRFEELSRESASQLIGHLQTQVAA